MERLGWLAGSWREAKDARETEEFWLPPKGGVMLGVNRTTRAGRAAQFEFLRIAKTERGVSYFAMPGGDPATEFRMVACEVNRVVFENEHHDFPNRVIYWLHANGDLGARIEGRIQGKPRAVEWRFQKTPSALDGDKK